MDDPQQEHVQIENVIPIAGNFQTTEGRALEPHYERLKAQSENNLEGLEVQLNGGMYNRKKQQAVVRFICDKDKTGNEDAVLQKRDDGNQVKGTNNTSLTFLSYGAEEGTPSTDILRLDWRTQYACEDFVEEEGDSTGGWGFFTWLILL